MCNKAQNIITVIIMLGGFCQRCQLSYPFTSAFGTFDFSLYFSGLTIHLKNSFDQWSLKRTSCIAVTTELHFH